MGWMQYIFRALILSTLLGLANNCSVFDKPFGTITGDQDLEVGSQLKLQCWLYANKAKEINVSSKNLRLKFLGKELPDIQITNNLTIEYVIPAAKEDNTGYYHCVVEHPDFAEQIVCTTFVSVGYKPLPAENFSCISKDYTNLTCSWKAPFNPVETKYTLSDYLVFPKLTRKCPVVLNNTSCQFRVDTSPVYLKQRKELNLVLEGSNSLGVNEQYITINHLSIVKLDPPRFVICTNITKNSLFMRWDSPKGVSNGQATTGLLYQLKYSSVSTKLPYVKDISIRTPQDLAINIGDLVPNTAYQFEVKIRLNITGDDFYWSETAKHVEKTRPDVPYLAPDLPSSAFDFQIIAGNRTITIYWKALPSEYENGNDFHYRIRYHEHYVQFRFKRDAPNYWVTVGNETSHTFENLDMNSAYIFNIYAANEKGNSLNETHIVINKMEKILQGPKDIMVVSYGQGNYSLTWKDPNMETTHFTLFWCRTLKSRPAKCDGPIEWLHTPNTSYHLLLSDHNTNYQFAVAANFNLQTSGMLWAPCIASYNVRYKVSEVKLVPKNSTSLRVQWSLGCRAQEKVTQKYLISYCIYEGKCVSGTKWKCETGWLNTTVLDPMKTEYILGSLKPFTCYFAFVRVLTNGGWSENSDYAYEATMPSAPSDPPRNVVATSLPVNLYSVEIEVLFEPPVTPNGIITSYKVFYNETEDSAFQEEISAKEELDGHFQVRIKNFIYYYKNYSVEVAACVHQACSEMSSPQYVYTGISNPSIVSAPRVELSDSSINITWEPPNLPNGPIDYYEVELYSNQTGRSERHTVNASNSLSLDRNCNAVDPDEAVYDFRVRAVNVEVDRILYGDFSSATKMVFCPSGQTVGYLIAGVVGAVIFAVMIIACLSYFVHKCNREYRERKNCNIKLPLELETPFGNSLASFDKLKNGLQKTAPDSSIPCDRTYERLCSFNQERNPCGGWGENDSPSHRNNSGESNKSGVSSADTTRTMVSMDSSGEQEFSPGETSQLPRLDRAVTDDLDQLEPTVVHNSNNDAISKLFIRPKNPPVPLVNFDDLMLAPYRKYNQIPSIHGKLEENRSKTELENHYQSRFSPESLYKMNSEPSLYGYNNEVPGMQPYSKVGLARSNTHLCESHRHTGNNIGYSRFGTMHSPNGGQDNPQIYTVFVSPHSQVKQPLLREKNIAVVHSNPSGGSAYSKFGVVSPSVHGNSDYVAVNELPGVCKNTTTLNGEADVPEIPVEENDPRSLMEIMSADERFCVPNFLNGEHSSNNTDLYNGIGSVPFYNVKPHENLPIFLNAEHSNNTDLCNGVGSEHLLENSTSDLAAQCSDVNYSANDFVEDSVTANPLRVTDSEVNPPHGNRRENSTPNHYVSVTELARRKIIVPNSITVDNLSDTPVASI